jgi:hypothetical protein
MELFGFRSRLQASGLKVIHLCSVGSEAIQNIESRAAFMSSIFTALQLKPAS